MQKLLIRENLNRDNRQPEPDEDALYQRVPQRQRIGREEAIDDDVSAYRADEREINGVRPAAHSVDFTRDGFRRRWSDGAQTRDASDGTPQWWRRSLVLAVVCVGVVIGGIALLFAVFAPLLPLILLALIVAAVIKLVPLATA